jgi:hypothetical protein
MTTPPSRTRSPFRLRLGTAAYALLTTLLLAAAACADGPTSSRPSADAAPVNAYEREPSCTDYPCEQAITDQCAPDRVELKSLDRPFAAQPVAITQGQQDRVELRAYDRDGFTLDLSWCTVTVSSSNTAVATVALTYDDGYRRTYTVNAVGGGQVTITASLRSIYGNGAGGTTFNYAVTPLTPTPTVGSISGPSVITSVGQYQYTVPASGGNGSYSFGWERSTDGGTTWSAYSTTNSGNPGVLWIGFYGGEYFKIRVRARSGNSAWSGYSPAFTIDARSAPPAAPLTASISGAQEAPSYTWCTWTAAVSGGTAPYTYSWIAVGTGLMDERISGATYSAIASHGAIELWLTVRDVMGQYVEVSRRLDVVSSGSCPNS